MKVIGRYVLLFVLVVIFLGIGKISFDYLKSSRTKEASENNIKAAKLPNPQNLENKEIAVEEAPVKKTEEVAEYKQVESDLSQPSSSVLIPTENKDPQNVYVEKNNEVPKSKALKVFNEEVITNSDDTVREEVREKEKLKENVSNVGNSYLPYLQVGGTRFFNEGSSAAAGLDFFVPLLQSSNDLIYTDLRFYDRSGKPFEGNVHVGYRKLSPEKENLYRIYGAFDRKRSEFGNYFNQLTFGAEFWHKNLFVGGNFYQPIGSKSKLTNITQTADLDRVYNNVWITTNKQYEKSMVGGDVEIGYEVVRGLIGYIGGYYFQAKDTNTICGPKAKLSYDWYLKDGKRILEIFDKLGLETGVQRDVPRGTSWYLSANFRVGLLPNKHANLQGVARHMVDLVRRDVDIVSGKTAVQSEQDLLRKNGKVVKLVDKRAVVEDKDYYYEEVKGDHYEFVSDTGHKHKIDVRSLSKKGGSAKTEETRGTQDAKAPEEARETPKAESPTNTARTPEASNPKRAEKTENAAKVKETPEVKKDAGKDEKKNRKNLRKMAEEKLKNL